MWASWQGFVFFVLDGGNSPDWVRSSPLGFNLRSTILISSKFVSLHLLSNASPRLVIRSHLMLSVLISRYVCCQSALVWKRLSESMICSQFVIWSRDTFAFPLLREGGHVWSRPAVNVRLIGSQMFLPGRDNLEPSSCLCAARLAPLVFLVDSDVWTFTSARYRAAERE